MQDRRYIIFTDFTFPLVYIVRQKQLVLCILDILVEIEVNTDLKKDKLVHAKR